MDQKRQAFKHQDAIVEIGFASVNSRVTSGGETK